MSNFINPVVGFIFFVYGYPTIHALVGNIVHCTTKTRGVLKKRPSRILIDSVALTISWIPRFLISGMFSASNESSYGY